MQTFIGLIRGINVGGKNILKMADLRTLLSEIGLEDVKTHLQSGNFVFRGEGSISSMETRLAKEAENRLGLKAGFFVRSVDQWRSIVEDDPFPDAAKSDPGHLLMFVGRDIPAEANLKAIQERYPGTEQIGVVGETVYVFCPDGIGTSKLLGSGAWVKATSNATARNWNTVVALLDMAG
ncbi:MAG: DUF1697 domain-containing protein [Armatimonadetes bacterium]|nr:DUF1697 domain-containing protein [Armatimonadota bacterium]